MSTKRTSKYETFVSQRKFHEYKTRADTNFYMRV